MFTSSYTIYKITQRANTYLNHFYNNIEPHYKLLFVTSGGCSVVIHHCQFQVQAGDCILIPPYVIHSAVFSKINSIELVEVQFNCVSTCLLYTSSAFCLNNVVFSITINAPSGSSASALNSRCGCGVSRIIPSICIMVSSWPLVCLGGSNLFLFSRPAAWKKKSKGIILIADSLLDFPDVQNASLSFCISRLASKIDLFFAPKLCAAKRK